MLGADRPATALAGTFGGAALTDLTQFRDAHTGPLSAVTFKLWREAYAARHTITTVPRSQLVLVLASVFAGLTVMLAVLGFAYSPVALAVSVPFGVVTYVLWYHASGRLRQRIRREARAGRTRTTTERGGFGAGPREDWTGPRSDGFGGARQREATRQTTGPSARDAYRTLGLDPGADEPAIRQAYREKVKETHPDTEGGTERRFKRVNEAYERLSE